MSKARVTVLAGLATAAGVVARIAIGYSLSDVDSTTITAGSSIALAAVTIAYVAVVYRQLHELRTQRSEESERWREEREREREDRRRARSEAAVMTALQGLYASGIRPGSGSPERDAIQALGAFGALEQQAPLVHDLEIRDRMQAAGVFAWMMTWPVENLEKEHVDVGMLAIHTRNAIDRCSATLQRYLVEEELPDWSDLPKYVGTQAWIYDHCRKEGTTPTPRPSVIVDDRTKRQRRADVLSAYARRAIFAARAQRERMRSSESPAAHDLDFYAHAAWQLREAGVRARDRLELDAVRPLLDELDAAVPRLKEYRDAMTHALDDRLPNAAWFGDMVVELLPGGAVDYIVDTRHEHHDALERFFVGLIDALEPLCSKGTDEWNENAKRGRPPPT